MKRKLLCAVMCCVLLCGTFAPKKAYAVAVVDDVAIGIVCALLAAAGVTFAFNDGVQDAVGDFLEESGGAYDVVLRSLVATAVSFGDVLAYKVDSSILPGVRGLLEGLFDFFKTDENRQGSVVVSCGSGYNFSSVVSSVSFDTFFDSPYIIDLGTVKDGISVYCGGFHITPSTVDKRILRCYFFDDSGSLVCYFYSFDSSKWNNLKLNNPFYIESPSFVPDYSSGFFFSSSGSYEYVYCVDNGKTFRLSSIDTGYFSSYFSFVSGSTFGFLSDSSVSIDVGLISSVLSSCPVQPHVVSGEKSIPYGLTFPEELTAPDVIDNFEQRVEAAAGDLAIVVPVDGVIDNTLPYAEAQEQYLANVNELGEITDTVTETNSWLSKILTAVKSIPAKVIGTGTLDFSGFQNIGLSSVFPFCIPFDLKNALVGFNVTPADPIWEISFEGTFMSAAGTYVLDMTKFEKLFAIVRFFIYGGFVVSLILLTRKIIKG